MATVDATGTKIRQNAANCLLLGAARVGHTIDMEKARKIGAEVGDDDVINFALYEAAIGGYTSTMQWSIQWGATRLGLAIRVALRHRQSSSEEWLGIYGENLVSQALHRRIFDLALIFDALGLPPYVQLWILDWAIAGGTSRFAGSMGRFARVSLLEGVRDSVAKLRAD